MNRREAKRLDEADDTRYGVLAQGSSGKGLFLVSGYRNAKIVRDSMPASVILTASEIEKLRG